MNAMVQTLVVALIVLAAAAYVGRRLWRTLRPKAAPGCGDGCGCSAEASRDDWAKT